VTFALEEPYAHGVVTLSTETAKAVLEHLRELEDLNTGECFRRPESERNSETLAALKEMVECYDGEGSMDLSAAKAAIAKASTR
jgi:hypothetical protein